MEQLVIKKRNGLEIPLFNRSPLSSVVKAEQRVQILSEDIVNVTIESTGVVDIGKGDTIEIFGSTYRINKEPTEKKTSAKIVYDAVFESILYDLRRPQWRLPASVGFASTGDEPLTADLKGFADVLLYNANRFFGSGTWVLGTFPTGTEIKTLSFSREKLLSVLQKLCQEYTIEFEIKTLSNVNTINFKKIGNILPDTFEYGKGKELYSIQRANSSSSDVATRLYAFGSTKNIKSGYRGYSGRLRLSVNEDSYVQDSPTIDPLTDSEATEFFEDVFPERTGVISDLVFTDINSFIDSSMDFDLNEKDANGTKWLIPKTPAVISFITGNLAGYDFELKEVGGYTHVTKTFVLMPFKDKRGQLFPDPDSPAFRMNVGDKYKILDINMPDSYVQDAEFRLLEKALERLDEVSKRKIQYSLVLNEMFFIKNYPGPITVNPFGIGDYITIVDDELNVNESIRITAFTRDILRPYKYDITVSESFDISIFQQIISDNKEMKDIVVKNNLSDPARSRRNWKTTNELSTMLDTLRAEMLLIYVEGGAYTTDIVSETNADGNVNKFRTTAGVIQHDEYLDHGGIWNVAAFEGVMSENAPYYIYVKASRANNAASIALSTEKITIEQDPMFYHFPYGILSSVFNGARVLSSTKGYTRITGNNIHTGRLVSNDGTMWIDLDSGEIRGTFRFTSGEKVEDVISQAEQTAIDAANAYTDTQKTVIDSEIEGLNTSLSNLDTYIDGAFSDNIIEEGEAIAIEKYINSLTAEKGSIDNRFNIIYNDASLSGTTKINLNTAKTAFNTGHTNLISSINNAIFDNKTTIAEKADVDAKFALYKTELATLNTRFEESVNFIAQAKADEAEANASAIAEAAAQAAQTANNYIDNVLPDRLSAIDAALDGLLEQHFQTYDPTTTNVPASDWNTIELKEEHLGDLFYNTSNGKSWRWVKEAGVYSWSEIINSDLQAALAAASKAQDTADSKRRVFTVTPFTPYDVGDLWVQGATGDIMKCEVAKTDAQTYLASDWSKAVKYTDDTAANAAATAASQAQTDANTANTVLGKIANDNILMPAEKQDVLQEWQIIQGEKTVIEAQATKYAINTLKTAYTNAYNALSTYIAPLLSNMVVESVIVGTTFRANFKTYYDAKVNLLKEVSDKAKDLADSAKSAADTADGKAVAAQNTANSAAIAASNAQTSASTANDLLTNIASDSKLTPSEKQQSKLEWDGIIAEKATIEAQATLYAITTEKTAYTTAYESLNTYITPILSNLTTTSDIVGTTFRANFSNYFSKRQLLLKAISDKAKSIADAAQAVADEVKEKTGIAYLPPGTIIIDPSTGTITANLINADQIIAKKIRTGTEGTRVEINMDGNASIRAFNKTGSITSETFSVVNGLMKVKGLGIDGRRMEIDTESNDIVFFGEGGRAMLNIKDNLQSFKDDDSNHTVRPLAGMVFKKPYTSNPSNPDQVIITGNGIYSNAASAGALIGGSLAYGAIVGYNRRRESLLTGDVNAGIVGLAGPSGTYGGFFKHIGSGVSLRVDGSSELNGSIKTNGLIGKTYDQDLDATWTLRFVNGIYIGTFRR